MRKTIVSEREYLRMYFLISLLMFMMTWGAPAFAQQPTATVLHLVGEASISDQGGLSVTATVGMVLSQGDQIQTYAGARAVLELSDGSEIALGENTNISISELSRYEYTGARKSRIKLWWGRVRSFLSPGHQAPGSSYEVQTPNALVGVKFSEPDTEVIFDPQENKTIALAHRFDLTLTSLVNGTSILIKSGQSGIVVGNLIQKVPGIVRPALEIPQEAPLAEPEPPQESPESMETPNVSSKTLKILGLSTAATAIGVATFISESEDGDDDDTDAEGTTGQPGSTSFTGNFIREQTIEPGITQTVEFILVQQGLTINGTRLETVIVDGCCTAIGTGTITGTVEKDTALLTVVRGAGRCTCSRNRQFSEVKRSSRQDIFLQRAEQVGTTGGEGQIVGVYWNGETGSGPATLHNNGNVLLYDENEYTRH